MAIDFGAARRVERSIDVIANQNFIEMHATLTRKPLTSAAPAASAAP
jgi:hypothetical protein